MIYFNIIYCKLNWATEGQAGKPTNFVDIIHADSHPERDLHHTHPSHPQPTPHHIHHIPMTYSENKTNSTMYH